MKIGLIDVDSHHFPNLALMKISAFYKNRGDCVDWWDGFTHYDAVFVSRVFDDEYSSWGEPAIDADTAIFGGTGFDRHKDLPEAVENTCPDYGLYPKFQQAHGFLTRGCPRCCPFCIVSEKEGRRSRQVAELDYFWRGQKEIKLLDPNLLACPDHERILRQLVDSGAWVDFTQGLDIRFITDANVWLLNRMKLKAVHFAWDNPQEDLTPFFRRYTELAKPNRHRKPGAYVLTNFNSTHEEDLYRVETLRALGYDPYVMIFNKKKAPRETRLLQRWCNNRKLFNTISFSEYDPRKG